MKPNSVLSILCFILILAGCSPVKFFSDQGLTKKSGLKFYTVKPYLQVEREPGSGRIIKSSVIYLPDLANPQYLEFRSGPGAAKTDIKLSDGMLTSFGFESARILPETIESLSTLISKTVGTVADINAMKGIPALSASNTAELYEIIMTDGKTILREVVPGN